MNMDPDPTFLLTDPNPDHGSMSMNMDPDPTFLLTDPNPDHGSESHNPF